MQHKETEEMLEAARNENTLAVFNMAMKNKKRWLNAELHTWGATPLMFLISRGKRELARKMAQEKDLDPFKQTIAGRTAFTMAIEVNLVEVAFVLLKKMKLYPEKLHELKKEPPLLVICRCVADNELFSRFLEMDGVRWDVNVKGDRGETALLHLVSQRPSPRKLQILLDLAKRQGTRVDHRAKTHHGANALHRSFHGNYGAEWVLILLDTFEFEEEDFVYREKTTDGVQKGVSILHRIAMFTKKSPMDEAVFEKTLEKCGRTLNMVDYNARTCLSVCIERNWEFGIECLLKQEGLEVNPEYASSSLLLFADSYSMEKKENQRLFMKLLEKDKSILGKVRDNLHIVGKTGMMYLLEKVRGEAAQYVMESCFPLMEEEDLHKLDADGRNLTYYMLRCKVNMDVIVRLIKQYNLDVNYVASETHYSLVATLVTRYPDTLSALTALVKETKLDLSAVLSENNVGADSFEEEETVSRGITGMCYCLMMLNETAVRKLVDLYCVSGRKFTDYVPSESHGHVETYLAVKIDVMKKMVTLASIPFLPKEILMIVGNLILPEEADYKFGGQKQKNGY